MSITQAYELGVKLAANPLHVLERINAIGGAAVLPASLLLHPDKRNKATMTGMGALAGVLPLGYLERKFNIDKLPTVSQRLTRGLPLLVLPALTALGARYLLSNE